MNDGNKREAKHDAYHAYAGIFGNYSSLGREMAIYLYLILFDHCTEGSEEPIAVVAIILHSCLYSTSITYLITFLQINIARLLYIYIDIFMHIYLFTQLKT